MRRVIVIYIMHKAGDARLSTEFPEFPEFRVKSRSRRMFRVRSRALYYPQIQGSSFLSSSPARANQGSSPRIDRISSPLIRVRTSCRLALSQGRSSRGIGRKAKKSLGQRGPDLHLLHILGIGSTSSEAGTASPSAKLSAFKVSAQ
jgi:hypothetical protein